MQIPKDYLVEKVVGPNVRGWTLKPQAEVQQLDVELLKETTDRETLIVFISKQGAIDPQSATPISVPQIGVPGAMLHQGHVAIRRSILLDVRAETITGLTRMEALDETHWMSPHEIAGILPIKVYQAYRYSQVPFELRLSAAPVSSKLNVQSQSLMRISQLNGPLNPGCCSMRRIACSSTADYCSGRMEIASSRGTGQFFNGRYRQAATATVTDLLVRWPNR